MELLHIKWVQGQEQLYLGLVDYIFSCVIEIFSQFYVLGPSILLKPQYHTLAPKNDVKYNIDPYIFLNTPSSW